MQIINNASRGTTRVRYESTDHKKRPAIQVTDVNGRQVEAPIRLIGHNASMTEIAITNMKAGIFFLNISDGETMAIRRIILQ